MASNSEPTSSEVISAPADAPPAVETSVEKEQIATEQLPQSVDAHEDGSSNDATSKPDDTLVPKDASQLQETIKALENEVEELKAKLKTLDKSLDATKSEEKKSEAKPDDPASAKKHDPPAEITRVQEHLWRRTKPATLGASGTAVLVAVGSRPRRVDTHSHDTAEPSKATEKPALAPDEPLTTDGEASESQETVPKRFAINSQRLLTAVTKRTKQDIPATSNTWVRPFKYLLHHEKEIRAGHKEAADRHESLSNKDSESDDPSVSIVTTVPTEDEVSKTSKSEKPQTHQEKLDDAAKDKALWGCIVEFMDKDMRDIFEMRERAGQSVLEEIEFGNLSWIYRAGDLAYHKFMIGGKPRHRAYQVIHVSGGRQIIDTANRSEEPLKNYGDRFADDFEDLDEKLSNYRNMRGKSSGMTPLVVDCFYFDFDGSHWGPRPRRFVIPEYTGSRTIVNLEVVPWRFLPNGTSVRAELVERGKRFVDTATGAHKLYSGRGHPDKWLESSQKESSHEEMNCDVVVDQGAGVEMIQRTDYRYDMDFGGGVIAKSTAVDERETFETAPCGIDNCVGCTDIWKEDVLDQECRSQYLDNTDLIQNATVEEMRRSDDRLMLLPVRVYAYALQARKWRAVCIDDISVLPPDENAFDNLVLPPEQKTLIEALVKNQIRQADFSGSGDNKSKAEKYHHGSMDIVRGKGRGLIILLHGVPGVGKTSTAECVASALKRPLFPVTCGDLGTSPEVVTSRLEEYFTLAQKWACVLLLDEADVFLARRETGDVKRNALVSVFLRVLEYYAGVLVLTTNRVAEFDEAFRSRIHVSIYYPPLKKKATEAIWNMNIERLKLMDVDYDPVKVRAFLDQFWEKTRSKELRSRRWNGRQIKNAFQTALALARWEFHDKNDEGKLKRPRLETKHFEMVEMTSKHFDEYIDEAASNPEGGAYSSRAMKRGYRKDDAKGLDLSQAQWARDNAIPSVSNRSTPLSRTESRHHDANTLDNSMADVSQGSAMPANMDWQQVQMMINAMQMQQMQTPTKSPGPAAANRSRHAARKDVDSDDE